MKTFRLLEDLLQSCFPVNVEAGVTVGVTSKREPPMGDGTDGLGTEWITVGETDITKKSTINDAGTIAYDSRGNKMHLYVIDGTRIEHVDAETLHGMDPSQFLTVADSQEISGVKTFITEPSFSGNEGVRFYGGSGNSGSTGAFRYNNSRKRFEGYINGNWQEIGGGGSGPTGSAFPPLFEVKTENSTFTQGSTGFLMDVRNNDTPKTLTCTLLSSPNVGDWVVIGDYTGDCSVTNPIIITSSHRIHGSTENLVITSPNAAVVLSYVDDNVIGWKIVNAVGIDSGAPENINPFWSGRGHMDNEELTTAPNKLKPIVQHASGISFDEVNREWGFSEAGYYKVQYSGTGAISGEGEQYSVVAFASPVVTIAPDLTKPEEYFAHNVSYGSGPLPVDGICYFNTTDKLRIWVVQGVVRNYYPNNRQYGSVTITKVNTTGAGSNAEILDNPFAYARGGRSSAWPATVTTQEKFPFSLYDNSTGIVYDYARRSFVVPTDGWYEVTHCVLTTTQSTGQITNRYALSKNQDVVPNLNDPNTYFAMSAALNNNTLINTHHSLSTTGTIYCNALDTIQSWTIGGQWFLSNPNADGNVFNQISIKRIDKVISANSSQQDGIIINPNLIINGNEIVNQRGFNGNWSTLAVGKYGTDRFCKTDANYKHQFIEEGSYIPSVIYTLSGSTLNPIQIVSPPSGHWKVGNIPFACTNVKLELGKIATTFVPDLMPDNIAKCQRYYWCMVYGFPLKAIAIESVGPNYNALSTKAYAHWVKIPTAVFMREIIIPNTNAFFSVYVGPIQVTHYYSSREYDAVKNMFRIQNSIGYDTSGDFVVSLYIDCEIY